MHKRAQTRERTRKPIAILRSRRSLSDRHILGSSRRLIGEIIIKKENHYTIKEG